MGWFRDPRIGFRVSECTIRVPVFGLQNSRFEFGVSQLCSQTHSVGFEDLVPPKFQVVTRPTLHHIDTSSQLRDACWLWIKRVVIHRVADQDFISSYRGTLRTQNPDPETRNPFRTRARILERERGGGRERERKTEKDKHTYR